MIGHPVPELGGNLVHFLLEESLVEDADSAHEVLRNDGSPGPCTPFCELPNGPGARSDSRRRVTERKDLCGKNEQADAMLFHGNIQVIATSPRQELRSLLGHREPISTALNT